MDKEHAMNTEVDNFSADAVEASAVGYADVQTKIMLRHPQEQIDEVLRLAILQEEAAYREAYTAWQTATTEVQAQIAEVQAHNAANPDELRPVPPLPAEPMLDLQARRACYRAAHVEVDLALTTETKDAHIEYDDDALVAYHHPATVSHTARQLADTKRERFKSQRAANVSSITVEVDGLTFDGDEQSQQRMIRAILLMTENDTQRWVLANNTVADVTKAQLMQACLLAAAQQSDLWIESN
ncbi:DUF4376 domain-containing protein [Pseudoalteromonas sp. SCSIO 43201]|nr:DUF4376 domain-containing protein [Pseudoalteromonas sp. SCSIO 43201]